MMKADLELVKEVLAGHRQSFSELVRRHQKALLRLSFRFTRDLGAAEDVVQETFIRAFEKLKLFEGRSSFKSWLYQIAINTAKNRLRKVNLEVMSLDNMDFGVVAGAERQLIQEDLLVHLKREVGRLPHRQKTAVVLRIFEDLSFKEIAQIMECPYDTAKANYRHGLMALRHRMEQNPEWAVFSGMNDFNDSLGTNVSGQTEGVSEVEA